MTAPLWASGVCAGVHAAGSRDVVYVPDNPLSHVLGVFGDQYADVRLLLATREEEAFGIAAGLYLGGRLPTVMLQSSGLGNSLNALTSLLLPYEIPVLIVISMRGDAGEWNAAQMPMGRAVRPILDAMTIPHVTVESPEEAAGTVRAAGADAFVTRSPRACLLPRRVTTAPGIGAIGVRPPSGSLTGSDPAVIGIRPPGGSHTGSDPDPKRGLTPGQHR